MPQYERGHSGQEIGEMQQRLADLGYEVTPTYEFDEYTEDALRRYQTDWLYAEGTGVADEQTLSQLEYHHANRDQGTSGDPQFGLIDEETQTQLDAINPDYGQYGEEPGYDAGAGGSAQVSEDGQHWWDGEQWNPFANPTPQIDSGVISETYQQVKQEAGELWDGVVDQANKIVSGEEPLPDVRN